MTDLFSKQMFPLCMGSVLYGDRLDEAASHRQLSQYTALGGTMLDTALCYGAWAPHGYEGMVEQVIGRWLAQDGHRDQVTLVTKGAHPHPDSMGCMRVTPEAIDEDLTRSLRHLQTDHIDLYLLHRDDPTQPLEPILQALEAAVKAGRIRHYGCSNWSVARMREAAALALEKGWQGFAANQVGWSLAASNADAKGDPTMLAMDAETLAWHHESGMPVMAYTSLAQGYLMHRIAGREIPPRREAIYGNPVNERILAMIRESGTDPLTLCLRYISRQPFASVPCAAFSSRQQLTDAMRAAVNPQYDAILEEVRKVRDAAL